jgi:transposase
VLELYVEHFLVPELQSGDIVLWGKLPTRKNNRAIALIGAKGARVEPLPAYSPDLDPIEECISKVKTEPRRTKADTVRKLRNALKRAFANVTARDARGWFKHCGLRLPEHASRKRCIFLKRKGLLEKRLISMWYIYAR